MSKPIVVTISHSLGKEEAIRRLQKGLSTASSSFQMLTIDEEIWSGDRMTFKVRALGQAAQGAVDVSDSSVTIEVALPAMLHKLAEVAQSMLKKRGQLLLEKK